MKGIFSTEDLNSYGFWIKTEGIKLSRFLKNPILLDSHSSWRDPVGKILAIENILGNLIGEIEFDAEDPEAVKKQSKYERGFLNAFSLGIDITKTSADPADLKPGQTRETVIECELIEISCVTIPSNKNAVRLYQNGELVTLSMNSDNPLVPIIKKEPEMKEEIEKLFAPIKEMLQLSKDANESDLVASIKKSIEENHTLKEKLSEALEKQERISERLEKYTKPEVTQSFDELRKNNPAELLSIKTNNPELYQRLVAGQKV